MRRLGEHPKICTLQVSFAQGCVVLISGEPGIGKSRIAQTIAERLGNERHTRLHYFCSPHHQDSALYLVITQPERAAGFRRDDTDERALRRFAPPARVRPG